MVERGGRHAAQDQRSYCRMPLARFRLPRHQLLATDKVEAICNSRMVSLLHRRLPLSVKTARASLAKLSALLAEYMHVRSTPSHHHGPPPALRHHCFCGRFFNYY